MIKYYIYPYKAGSRSARALATTLGGKVLRREGGNFLPRSHKKVINWGSSQGPEYICLNTPDKVARVTNKLQFFQDQSDAPEEARTRLPRYSTDRSEATGWSGTDLKIVARTVLTGHSGQGIVIKGRGSFGDLPDAPLYVEYIPKDAEYRIHIFNNEVIDVQRKVKDPTKEPSDWAVRSHQNGFIFTRSNSSGVSHKDSSPPDVLEQAKKAMGNSGLCFGGVDVIWNKKRKKAYVLEVNSACGLEGQTVQIYANAVRKYYEDA